MKTPVTFLVLSLGTALVAAQEKSTPPATQPAQVSAATATSPLDFTLADIDGKAVPLSKYRGQVVLLVNVASKCGLTPQYEQLEQLHKKYSGQGLRILGFPANNFGQQEPGTNQEIREFCSTKYGVTFDLFAKVSVKGADICELYKWLTAEDKNAGHGGEVAWNFTKFLVGRDGKVLERFEPKTKPDDSAMLKAIEAALGSAAPAKSAEPAKKS